MRAAKVQVVGLLATSMLAGCLASGSLAQGAGDLKFDRVVNDSNQCLQREASSRVGKRLTLTAGEHSAIRTEVADACYIYNAMLARFTRDVHEGTRSLDDVTKVMLEGSLQLAGQLIDAQLEANAKAKARGQ